MEDEEISRKARDKALLALRNLMKCGICLDPFDNGKNQPKVLNCGHRVCLSCLKDRSFRTNRAVAWGYSDIRCPFCTQITTRAPNDLREDLPDNLLVDDQFLQAITFMAKHIGCEDTADASTQTDDSETQTQSFNFENFLAMYARMTERDAAVTTKSK